MSGVAKAMAMATETMIPMVDRLSCPGGDLVLRLWDANASRRCADSDCDPERLS